MILCDQCWRETDGYSVHGVPPERRPNECSRCGQEMNAVGETRVEIDDSNPLA